MLTEPLQKAKRMALMLLQDEKTVTTEMVASTVDRVLAVVTDAGVDREQLIKDVESACNVYVPAPTALEGKEDHVEWLPDRRNEIDWRLWKRYRRYLEDVKDWAPQATARLDDVTDQILRRLEDPHREGSWDRRGMVVGHVQSGKTANYTGLVCKAADAGYKLIIVLAGVHDSLRSQTQLRLDEGFLGYDTQKRMLFDQTNSRLGVGLLKGVDFYHVNSLTSSKDKGDFKKSIASTANITVGGADPLLLVVKKNKSILNNLISWVTSAQQELQHGETKPRVPNVPMLVIDDECDHASVNTKDTFDTNGKFDPDVDPTAINGCIRRLLDSFEQTAYVGYTATPFANIFIYSKAETDDFGEDLFPRSFIISLRPSSDYIGASAIFGLDGDPDLGIDAAPGMPIIRTVDDALSWVPPSHKSTYRVPKEIPPSLREALLSFMLVCAARRARGQSTEHNSMLLHVTRFTAVQQQLAEILRDELSYMKHRIEFGDGTKTSTIRDELRSLWNRDFVPTSAAFHDPNLRQVTWAQVAESLQAAVSKIEINVINGTAKDALEYFGKPNGVSVIAIGGDKLSRGLTLEGLSVSYYLRTSRMYDTLLQMGRWFGYRPAYADLCRLYTTADLQRWYKNITMAQEELLLQFDEMALTGGTPDDFGLRVRTSPDGLMITAAAKMRNGTQMKLSFASSISETIMFARDAEVIAHNYDTTASFISQLQATVPQRKDPPRSNIVWDGVGGDAVAAYLDAFRSHPGATKAQTKVMAKYIRSRLNLEPAELTRWTICLVSAPGEKVALDGVGVGLTKRAPFATVDDVYTIRRLVSPIDETTDLKPEELEKALEDTRTLWSQGKTRSKQTDPPTIPSGPSIRQARPSTRGLLLIYPLNPDEADMTGAQPIIGLAVSFPKSGSKDAIDYVINNTYWEQELSLE